ncbi:MAG TPA: paraquat-inducible protein A [Usitatibacteraceae bacterium]
MKAVACPDCDLLHVLGPQSGGEKARCLRCGGVLTGHGAHSYETSLALAIAATITFILANTAPLMQMSELGQESSTTVAGSALEMWLQGSEPTAILVAICSIVAPGFYLALMLAVLIAFRKDRAPPWAGRLMRWADAIHPWAMPEVMLLGTLVAYVKISELADATPGSGMYATGALCLLIAALGASLNYAALWARIKVEQ